MEKSALLKQFYGKIKAAYLKEIGYEVPERYSSCFVHWGGGVEVQYIYKKFTEDLLPGAKMLIVGVMGGRDYFLFKNLGFEVDAMDIGPQKDIDSINYANIEDNIPFDNGTFDVVIIGEVLEHLGDDISALENIWRVLKTNGRLIVSIPFYNDREEGHMRIHSPLSGRRLLHIGGFVIKNYLERPAIIAPNFFNFFQHGLSLAAFVISGRTLYPSLTRLIGAVSYRLGHFLWLRPLRRLSKTFGGYYLCKKGKKLDYLSINKILYTSTNSDAAAAI